MARGRRHPAVLPHLTAIAGRKPTKESGQRGIELWYESVQRALTAQEAFNRNLQDGFSGLPTPHEETHLVGGSDALQTPGQPLTVLVGGTASIGTGPSYLRENAQLVVGAGTTLGLANANANGSAFTASRGDHQHKRDVRVKAAGSDVGTRNAIDFVNSGSVTWTVTDDAGGDKVTVSAATSGGAVTAGLVEARARRWAWMF